MKKTLALVALCMVIVLSLPSTSVFAFSGTDIKVHTRESVSQSFDSQELNNIAQNIYNFVPSSTNWVNASKVYDKINILPSSALNYSNYVLVYTSNKLQLLCFDGDSTTIFVNTGALSFKDTIYSANDGSSGNGYINIPVVNGGYSFSLYECSWTDSSQWSGQGYTSASSEHYYSLYFGGSIISTNIPMFFYEELNMKSIQHTGVTSSILYAYPELYNQLTDFANSNLSYVDGDGNIINPTPQFESNKNHLYFKSCDIGFCYPKTSSNPASFGGAYFYVKYEVDDWIVSHISEYNLVFYADAEIGNSGLTNTIRYEIPLDPDGCITIPFSRVWVDDITSKGFTVYVTDSYVEDNFYKAYLYSMSASSFNEFGAKHAYYDGTPSILGALAALGSGGIDAFMFYIENSNVDIYTNLSNVSNALSVKYNPYLITAFTLIESENDSSGLYQMEFDLVTGTEDVTDTGGLVNPDPFVPSDTDTPDYVPSAPSGGNSTSPTVIINTGGTWQGVFNGVFHDDSLQNLKETVDAYPQVPNKKFWDYFLVFKDNAFLEATSDFFDALPNELSALLISSIGIIGVFAIYRFVRRR